MKILFLRFPLESALNGGAELQTVSLMQGMSNCGHAVAFAGSCSALLAMCRDHGIPAVEWTIGPPPVTKKSAVTFAWRRRSMKKRLMELLDQFHDLDAVVMLSLSEKLLLTDIAAAKGIKVFWIEHDRVGSWLSKNPWLTLLLRQSMYATTITVSELSRHIYLQLGWEQERIIAIPNGVDTSRFSPIHQTYSRDDRHFSPIPQPLPPMGEGGDDWPDEYKKKPPVNQSTLFHAREMRKAPTKAEELLWAHLRHDRLGVRFRRQHAIEGKILDFYCDPAKIAIEVDGPTHDEITQKEWDNERTEKLEAKGIRVIRFTNEQVLTHIDDVIEDIKRFLKNPPPSGEGGATRRVGELRLACIARLSHEKGVDVLLQAISKIPDVHLEIVGSGREESALHALAASLKLSDRITWMPHEKNIANVYARNYVLVLPSREHDPFGMVAAEAMMLGIPVIVTDACGIADYLENGKDALVVKAGSVDALKEAIERCKTEDVRRKIGEAGRKTAMEKFSHDTMIDRYEQLLESMS